MRLTFTIFWCLVVFWLVAPDVHAQGPPAPLRVKGYGQALDAARDSAFRQACEEMSLYLPGNEWPFTAWQEDQLRQRFVQQFGQQGPDQEVPPLGMVKTWVIEVPAAEVAHWVQLGHQVQRLRWAGRGWLALLAGLGVGWLYCHVNQWT